MTDDRPAFDLASVRAIAFDGFGTLFDYPASRFKHTFADYGRTLTPALEGDTLWERWQDVGKRRWGQAKPEEGQGRTPAPFRRYREVWHEQFEMTFRELEHPADPAEGTAMLMRELIAARAYPEVAAALERLATRYPLALVSNADEEFLHPPLSASGLRFGAIVSSESARAYKPQPEIFRHAAEQLGLPPTAILYVGDSPRADVEGAIGAGLQVAWLNREGDALPEKIPLPHLEIHTLNDLLPTLLPGGHP
ncbi:MAG: HAD family hydrolase [Dehalococcoidia bacterium]|nr:HAD family hydrolase [Dehalococcoidia bacterium]